MSPVDALKNLVKFDPAVARIVYAALGVLAAATVVLGWSNGGGSALPLAGWMMGLGLLLVVLGHIITVPFMRATLCWMVILTIGMFQLYVFSAMFPQSFLRNVTGPVAPLACAVRLIFDVNSCLNQLATADLLPDTANRNAPETLWLAQADAAPPGTTVYLQFGEAVPRKRMIAIGTALASTGWGVEDADKGGEQVREAPDANEVRYFNAEDAAAAEALAKALEPLIGGMTVGVRDLSRFYGHVKRGQLEIWLREVRPSGFDS
jgi:hypothetical protein